ncbi:MAG: prolipoprotein diacylglyceryl transferase [Spirochaetales bacterium]|nr:prolipoprotein diacylglyceryl transferase [Spirochaetales bacterium]
MLAFLNYPNWINPVIIPGLPFHWYGLMYLFAFGTTYILFKYQVKKDQLKISDDDIVNLFFWTILGLIIGARIFSTLVYDTSGLYWRKPWLIFWPFNSEMQMVGLQGMSYHGGLIGAVLGLIIYVKSKKLSFFHMADLLVAGIPLGYTFGRLGNFINGELWGRVTSVSWGMIFPYAPAMSTKLEWVKKLAEKAGLPYQGLSAVNLPRHPSQLYEAFFEGIFLWVIIWFIFRKRKAFHGFLLAVYLIGYGTVRFFIEYFREPDGDLGFIFFKFSMGQILCFLMIILGIFILFIANHYKGKTPQKADNKSSKKLSNRKIQKRINKT